MSEMHIEYCELLPEYLSGSLSESVMTSLRQHLEQCEACRSELDEIRSTLSFVESSSEMRVSPGYWQTILLRVNQRKGVHNGWRWIESLVASRFALPALASAALLMIVLLQPVDLSVERSLPDSSVSASLIDEIQDPLGVAQADNESGGMSYAADIIQAAGTDDTILRRTLSRDLTVVGGMLDERDMVLQISKLDAESVEVLLDRMGERSML